jgi:hypothetical protein
MSVQKVESPVLLREGLACPLHTAEACDGISPIAFRPLWQRLGIFRGCLGSWTEWSPRIVRGQFKQCRETPETAKHKLYSTRSWRDRRIPCRAADFAHHDARRHQSLGAMDDLNSASGLVSPCLILGKPMLPGLLIELQHQPSLSAHFAFQPLRHASRIMSLTRCSGQFPGGTAGS